MFWLALVHYRGKKMNPGHEPLLSVVATSRNDNHGKNLLYRMQLFVNGFVQQCKKHDIKAELILVEWNPPHHTLPLSQAIQFPKEKGPCTIRIIRVPKEVHDTLEYADKIPLFQMIGKNVGIRRAKGKFVLATNIDILFSDPLMEYLKRGLKSGRLYRTDRLDVPEQLPEHVPFDEILNFCSNNILRINEKRGTFAPSDSSKQSRPYLIKKILRLMYVGIDDFFKKIVNSSIKDLVLRLPIVKIPRIVFNCKIKDLFLKPIPYAKKRLSETIRIQRKNAARALFKFCPGLSCFPHTNACGDFTLLSSRDWASLRGYPEWNQFSWHLDSILVFQARQHRIVEVDLPRQKAIYHIEHEAGSGFSPESAHILFNRLSDKGIPYIDDKALNQLLVEMRQSKGKVIYNDDNWGMASLSLEELIV